MDSFAKKTMCSITSPVLVKKGFREFTSSNLISNSVHEFSHSIFKKKLIDSKKFEVLKISLKEQHIEETFIKALTHFILVNLYKPFMPAKESEEKEMEILDKIVKDGYIYAPTFYEEFKKGTKPIEAYTKVLKKNVF